MDLLSGLPVGLNGFLFVMVQRIVTDQRRIFMGQPFLSVFFGYCVVVSGVHVMQWGVFCLVSAAIIPFMPIAGTIVLGIVFFPLALLLMNATHKILPYAAQGMKQTL